MRCLVVSSGVLSLAPDGAVCGPSDLVAVTSEEVAQFSNSPFNLTVDEGAQVGGAVLLVWAAAFGIRVLARLFLDRSSGAEVE